MASSLSCSDSYSCPSCSHSPGWAGSRSKACTQPCRDSSFPWRGLGLGVPGAKYSLLGCPELLPCEGGRGAESGGCPMLAEHLPPGSHALRGGGWGGQELQAPAQLKPPRAKASRAVRAPGGSTARCIQPGQQWPQEPWRSGTAPCPALWGDGSAPAALTGGPNAPRWSSRAFRSQFRPPWECPLPALTSSGDLTNHRTFSFPRKPIITCVSASVTARWSLVCPVSLEPMPQQRGAADHSG